MDFTAVEKALEAIDRTKNLTQQSDVDKMAKDINDAVEALVYKSADYTELDKAEKAAKALNKDDYEDFSEVEKALAAIDRTKNITEQADVAMVKAINDAVANLVKKAPASSQPDSVSSSDASSDTSSSASDSSSSDSKSDSSSKAASNASNTNPSTGVAGGAFALALLSGAAVVMAKKKK